MLSDKNEWNSYYKPLIINWQLKHVQLAYKEVVSNFPYVRKSIPHQIQDVHQLQIPSIECVCAQVRVRSIVYSRNTPTLNYLMSQSHWMHRKMFRPSYYVEIFVDESSGHSSSTDEYRSSSHIRLSHRPPSLPLICPCNLPCWFYKPML